MDTDGLYREIGNFVEELILELSTQAVEIRIDPKAPLQEPVQASRRLRELGYTAKAGAACRQAMVTARNIREFTQLGRQFLAIGETKGAVEAIRRVDRTLADAKRKGIQYPPVVLWRAAALRDDLKRALGDIDDVVALAKTFYALEGETDPTFLKDRADFQALDFSFTDLSNLTELNALEINGKSWAEEAVSEVAVIPPETIRLNEIKHWLAVGDMANLERAVAEAEQGDLEMPAPYWLVLADYLITTSQLLRAEELCLEGLRRHPEARSLLGRLATLVVKRGIGQGILDFWHSYVRHVEHNIGSVSLLCKLLSAVGEYESLVTVEALIKEHFAGEPHGFALIDGIHGASDQIAKINPSYSEHLRQFHDRPQYMFKHITNSIYSLLFSRTCSADGMAKLRREVAKGVWQPIVDCWINLDPDTQGIMTGRLPYLASQHQWVGIDAEDETPDPAISAEARRRLFFLRVLYSRSLSNMDTAKCMVPEALAMGPEDAMSPGHVPDGGGVVLSGHIGHIPVVSGLIAIWGGKLLAFTASGAMGYKLTHTDHEGRRNIDVIQNKEGVGNLFTVMTMHRALKSGSYVVALIDEAQITGRHFEHEFFGVPKPWPVGFIDLARHAGTSIYFGAAVVLDDGRIKVIFHRLPLPEGLGKEAFMQTVLDEYVGELEALVRAFPEQAANIIGIYYRAGVDAKAMGATPPHRTIPATATGTGARA
jgi:hypothetical protein